MKWNRLSLGAALLLTAISARAQFHPVDLGPFVAPSGFDAMEAWHLTPTGDQVIAGTPYRIDGIVQLDGGGPRNAGQNYPSEVGPIPLGRSFGELRLLSGAAWSCPEGDALAVIELIFDDGTKVELPVRFGHHVHDHYGERYRIDAPLLDERTRVTWRAEHWDPARWDKQLRFFESVHTNPSPSRIVRSIVLRSTGTQASLMVMGIAAGPPAGAALVDTWSFHPALEPDDPQGRSGESLRVAGEVMNPDLEPIAGARVSVLSARNFGTYTRDASFDHPALGQTTLTDTDGRYAFDGLPNDRIYQFGFQAGGFETRVHGGVDPLRGPGVVWLKPSTPVAPEPFEVRGVLVDAEGNPIAGAMITPYGVKHGQGTRWGGNNGFPEWRISALDGTFAMGRDESFDELQVDIRVSGFAPEKLWLEVSDDTHRIVLGEGSRIVGALRKDGEPLANVRIGISGRNRSAEVYAGHYETVTDGDGRFEFRHLKPATEWWLYGIIESLGRHGALPPMPVNSTEHGAGIDLGDLQVSEGLAMQGRVVTTADGALPSDFSIRVGNDKAWDSILARPDAEGRFKIHGLYPELLEVSIATRGWRLTSRNRSFDTWNSHRLTGLFERDHAEIVLEVEPGQSNFNSPGSNGQLPQQDQSRSRPLRGIERVGGAFIRVAGSVMDEDTGEPIRSFTLLPGRQPPIAPKPSAPNSILDTLKRPFRNDPIPWNERVWWDFSRKQSMEEGRFDVEFEALTSTPLIQITAEGYEPFISDPFLIPTNMTIRLERGRGPSGIVLLPNGDPAEAARIVYAAGREQFGLYRDGRLTIYNRNAEHSADLGADGQFSFNLRADGVRLFAAHKEGWASVDANDFRGGGKIRLKKWAGVKGVLVDANGNPVPGENLNVTMSDRMQRGEPFVNIQDRVTTDARGRFTIDGIPPEPMQLVRLVPMTTGGFSRGWTHKLQTYVDPRPGQIQDLGRIVMDQPPPPPLMERVKEKLGL